MRKSRTYKKRRGGQYAPAPTSSFGDTASQYGEKAKESIVSGFSTLSNWFSNLGKPSTTSPAPYSSTPYSPAPTYTNTTGGRRRRRFKTRRNRKTRTR